MPSACSTAGGPMPGELQQLRRLQRAGGEDHFAPRRDRHVAPALAIGHAAGTAAVEQDPRRLRLGRHRQILAARAPGAGRRPRSSSGSRGAW